MTIKLNRSYCSQVKSMRYLADNNRDFRLTPIRNRILMFEMVGYTEDSGLDYIPVANIDRLRKEINYIKPKGIK